MNPALFGSFLACIVALMSAKMELLTTTFRLFLTLLAILIYNLCGLNRLYWFWAIRPSYVPELSAISEFSASSILWMTRFLLLPPHFSRGDPASWELFIELLKLFIVPFPEEVFDLLATKAELISSISRSLTIYFILNLSGDS